MVRPIKIGLSTHVYSVETDLDFCYSSRAIQRESTGTSVNMKTDVVVLLNNPHTKANETKSPDHKTEAESEENPFVHEGERDIEERLTASFNGQSYVVVTHLWEQLMASAFNYLQAQCWTNSIGGSFPISIVEPQTRKDRSILGFSFNYAVDPLQPLVSNIFDMESFYSQWPKEGGKLAPMVTKRDFVSEIKRFGKNVIFVQLDYKSTKERECKFTWDTAEILQEFKQYPFLNVSRKVCIYVSNNMPGNEFKKLVLGDVGINNTLIVFKEWRGLGSSRLLVKVAGCVVGKTPYGLLKPSVSVLQDAEMYANKSLGGFGNYVSVSARFEKVARDYFKLSLQQRRKAVAGAITEALEKVQSLRIKAGVSEVYLAYDYGKYGSRTFEQNRYYNSGDLLVKFQEDVYSGRLSYKEYKQSLDEFKFQNPGYVAMVQMTLASRGRCLLRLGFGHCINFVTSLYKVFHKNKDLCLECAPHTTCQRH